MATNPRENARVQVRCWLLDELLAAEDDLLALLARPEVLAGGLEAAALSGAGAGHQRQGHGRRRAAHRCRELRPDLAAWEKNLLVVSSALHRNVHKWLGNRPCEPKDFVDYLLRNELAHVEASPSTRARQEVRQQKLIHRLELLQARDEGNRLLY